MSIRSSIFRKRIFIVCRTVMINICAFFILTQSSSLALEDSSRYYSGYVQQIYDGDTLTMMIDLGLGVWIERKVRIYGIDTPEIKGKTQYERDLAVAARDYVIQELSNRVLTLEHVGIGKYGRLLCNIYYENDSKSIADQLVLINLAKPYYKGSREKWEEEGEVSHV